MSLIFLKNHRSSVFRSCLYTCLCFVFITLAFCFPFFPEEPLDFVLPQIWFLKGLNIHVSFCLCREVEQPTVCWFVWDIKMCSTELQLRLTTITHGHAKLFGVRCNFQRVVVKYQNKFTEIAVLRIAKNKHYSFTHSKWVTEKCLHLQALE